MEKTKWGQFFAQDDLQCDAGPALLNRTKFLSTLAAALSFLDTNALDQ